MAYLGYRVKIEGTEVPNMLIASGTYSFIKAKRPVRRWTDANGMDHIDFHANKKAFISFAIRERNLSEQETIKGIFAKQDNLTVEYWDDYDCEYKTGTFEMTEPEISHKKGLKDDILYNTTQITLEEY